VVRKDSSANSASSTGKVTGTALLMALAVDCGAGVLAVLAFGALPVCCVTHAPTAKTNRASDRPRVVFRLIILRFLFGSRLSTFLCSLNTALGHIELIYFDFVLAAAGEAAGLAAGLVAGLAVVAGAVSVVLLGEAAVTGAGVEVVAGEFELEFELVAGSSPQPTANAIARTAGSNNAVRLISLVLELLMVFPRSSKIEKAS
jgi:hypothetical protein